MLCDPRLDIKEIRETLPKQIVYKEALDISFVESCITAAKVVPVASFKLRTNEDLK